ncbi:MAG: hypothetical protein AAFS03_11735, partial [Pseudomonadota bacterium]
TKPEAAPPPKETPPSAGLAAALRFYKSGKHRAAALGFHQIATGEAKDTPGNVQKAQFFLAKSLYHIGFYQSALAFFDEISQAGRSMLS